MDNEPTLRINSLGEKTWWLNGKLHRVDGPAIEHTDGTKFWYFNGKAHRVDGPALEWADGIKTWWLNGNVHYFDDWLELNTFISEEEKLMLKLIHG
jgi:hypothetical protein